MHSRRLKRRPKIPGQNSIGTGGQNSIGADNYGAHNRTVTYTELAAAIGSTDYRSANIVYGKLGRSLGEAVNYTFPIAGARGKPFYSGSLGVDAPRTEKGEYRLMMHHELAKAIGTLGWFNN